MRSIKKLLLVAIVAFGAAFNLNASEITPNFDSENVRLSYEIQHYLTEHDFDFKKEIISEVLITLNKNHEIVVLSVENDNERVQNFIKSRLNYKKLSSHYKGKDKLFRVSVKLMPNS